MSKIHPSVFTIAPGTGFLHELAQQILSGFPLDEREPKPPLSDWTILLPTRRAARELSKILIEKSGRKALLLPQISPFGDLDEDRLFSESEAGDLPPAISRTGQLLTLISLLEEWANDNPQISLAREIQNSHKQSLSLATSLLQLLIQIETEEANFERLMDVYEADLSEHRYSILSLINLLKIALPQKLHAENLLSPIERRNHLIRLEAERISKGGIKGPIIAAGSTGTIPATRALLKAIALHPKGAVILPGLDKDLDDPAWDAITPEHPQHTLRTLINELEVSRANVKALGISDKPRNWLTSELMRPTATAEQWHINLKGGAGEMALALENVHLVEAIDRHNEARSIALILRGALETPKQTAALVTPDRDLAKRVKAELLRWNIVIDDSAGEPLAQFGLASLSVAVLSALANNFTPASLLAVLTHPDCNLGLDQETFTGHLRHFEVAVLRGYSGQAGLEGLQLAFDRALETRHKNLRTHTLIAALKDEDWQNLDNLVKKIIAALSPLTSSKKTDFASHIENFETCLATLAPNADWSLAENRTYAEILFELKSQGARHPIDHFIAASVVILYSLNSEPHRTAYGAHPRLAIYGTLEARLMPAEIMILGGLNEGVWPAQPDTGPWLNRTMRGIFGLHQPEREIGMSAHDFMQGLGHKIVYLTWAKRIEGSPQIPSRWILRLQTVMQVSGFEKGAASEEKWPSLAKAMDQPARVTPHQKPKPTPPVAARPTRYSVSSVEKLIRDPYSLYANRILQLYPIPPLAQQADAPLRGTLFHDAISQWNKRHSNHLVHDGLEILIAEGRKVFLPLMNDPEIASFWWPRFKRMANWMAKEELEFRQSTKDVHAEIEGWLAFEIAGEAYTLTARADRIDTLQDGKARIIDYKTGTLPTNPQVLSGLSPQLPLEAAILAKGGFANIPALATDQLIYLQISGADDEGIIVGIKSDKEKSLTEIGLAQFASLKSLLEKYRNPDQPYYPRSNIFKEEQATDYDHLSRYAEWMLAGEQ
jgi:ATP-dependent helicase/nuclease subunit B